MKEVYDVGGEKMEWTGSLDKGVIALAGYNLSFIEGNKMFLERKSYRSS